jgi:two-component system sensor histidine kinase KdpD
VAVIASGPEETSSISRLRYLWAAAACAIPTLVAALVPASFDFSNIVMLFLLTVFFVAVKLGRGPAVLATFLSIASFDFFFVPPRFSFAVSDAQYLFTFMVMLVVGLVTGQLAAGLRYQARIASHRERRSRALYEFARDLSSPLQIEDIVRKTIDCIGRTFNAGVVVLLTGPNGRLIPMPELAPGPPLDPLLAEWAFDQSRPTGAGTDILAHGAYLYLPLRATMRTAGVLAIRPGSGLAPSIPEQRQDLDTFATLVAIALERVHYIEVAQRAVISVETERLRNSLLSALSHDLRTPLAALLCVAESLRLTKPVLSEQQLDMASMISEAAKNMTRLVNNLLEMARIQSGELKLNLQWQPFEEVVGSALRASRPSLARHRVEVEIENDLPLVRFDAALIERVLYNLLDNAAKYAQAGTTVRIGAVSAGDKLLVTVADDGPGLPPGQEEQIFEKFTRGDRESATSGVGLGLSICRAIVEAHHSRIWAENGPGGARFLFTLSLSTPPDLSTDVEPL